MKNTRIQIVEDERIVALDLKQALEALGCEITGIVATGPAAIELARRSPPDLILMDIHLEGPMDGTEAARAIRSVVPVPIIFLTAYAEDDNLRRAAASAPYGYLVKPYEMRELRATLQMALSRRTAELDIESAEERLRLAVDAAELGVWEWDTDSGHLKIGGHFSRIVGGAPTTFLEGESALLHQVHGDDRAVLVEALQQPGMACATVRLQRDAGVHLWAEIHAKRHGEHRVVGVLRDVTERKEMEEKLRQASVVFRTTAEGIAIMDKQQRIVSINPAFSLLTAMEPDEVIGRTPDEVLHARRHSPVFYERLEASEHGYWNGETVCLRRSGERFTAWEHVCAVRYDLGQVVQYVLAFSDLSAIRDAELQLNHLAFHDALTGLGNRNLLAECMESEIERSRRSGIPIALIFIDLDGFKTINDTLGHAVGDELLKQVAQRLRGTIRRADMAFRLGGDEFVVLAPDMLRIEDGAGLADKLLRAVREPLDLSGHKRLVVSASLGIAVFPANGEDVDHLIRAADSAMYDAKRRGRNRYCFYAPEMAERVHERMRIEQGLRHAVEHQELMLYYQPVVALPGRQIIGVEALVRWQHPENGLVSPARFIPVAEESGLIEAVGRWVLHAACQQGAAWHRQGHPNLTVAVNVSVRQMAAENFIQDVTEALEGSGFTPQFLELEITESLLQELELSRRVLWQLRSMGIRIAVDDFGTGFSSLSYLKHLPLDRIKIDQSFVRDLPGNANDMAIVRAIIGLSKTLEMEVTAEGIETEAQLAFLCAQGCPMGQGYLFARPMPPQELAVLLGPGSP